MDKKPFVCVAAALIREGDRFLICQRPANKARGLKWEFVGGKTEEGETPEAALVRECREELGVEIKTGRKYAEVVHSYPDLKVRLVLFEAEILSGEIKLLEHAAAKWITAGESANYEFCGADKPILAKLRKESGKWRNRKPLGIAGEKKAARCLKRKGYKIVEKNWRTPFCEIDIIAKKGDTYVFCEVKTRSDDGYGTPAEGVNDRKKSLYVRAAKLFSAGKGDIEIRFDVIEVFKGKTEHIENAFGADICP